MTTKVANARVCPGWRCRGARPPFSDGWIGWTGWIIRSDGRTGPRFDWPCTVQDYILVLYCGTCGHIVVSPPSSCGHAVGALDMDWDRDERGVVLVTAARGPVLRGGGRWAA